MKMIITIVVESRFKPLRVESLCSGVPDDVTVEVEADFHRLVDLKIRRFVEESLEGEVIGDDSLIEGKECFSDYGEVSINVKTEKVKA